MRFTIFFLVQSNLKSLTFFCDTSEREPSALPSLVLLAGAEPFHTVQNYSTGEKKKRALLFPDVKHPTMKRPAQAARLP